LKGVNIERKKWKEIKIERKKMEGCKNRKKIEKNKNKEQKVWFVNSIHFGKRIPKYIDSLLHS
jgi:hypothetical protein